PASIAPTSTATATPSPTASPRPNPTTGPGTYVNAALGYRVVIPAGWRRSACVTTRGDPRVPYVETFTTASVDEEIGTDTGPASDTVSIRTEDAAGLTAQQWLSTGRLGTAVGQRFESTTFDGRDAARIVVIATNTPIAYVVPARGHMRSEEHTSELQSPYDLVCRLLLEKKKKKGQSIGPLDFIVGHSNRFVDFHVTECFPRLLVTQQHLMARGQVTGV